MAFSFNNKDYAGTVCKTCAEKQVIEEFEKEFKPALEKIYKLVNNMNFDHNGYASDAIVNLFFNEHRQLQGDLLNFMAKILKKIGSRSGDSRWEDPRNQWALAYAKRAAATIYPS